MMAGILSVGTFTLSMYIENRTLVILTAAILFYLNVAYLGSIYEHLGRWSMQQILYFPFQRIISLEIIIIQGIIYSVVMILYLEYFLIGGCREGESVIRTCRVIVGYNIKKWKNDYQMFFCLIYLFLISDMMLRPARKLAEDLGVSPSVPSFL